MEKAKVLSPSRTVAFLNQSDYRLQKGPARLLTNSRPVTFITTCQDNVIKWHPFVISEQRAGNVNGGTWRRCDCAVPLQSHRYANKNKQLLCQYLYH